MRLKSVLLCGAETSTFNRCLRFISNIFWPNKITSKELWELIGVRKVSRVKNQEKEMTMDWAHFEDT